MSNIKFKYPSLTFNIKERLRFYIHDCNEMFIAEVLNDKFCNECNTIHKITDKCIRYEKGLFFAILYSIDTSFNIGYIIGSVITIITLLLLSIAGII